MPKISIIVPVYNVEKFLDKCICSIVKQTFRDVEIILIDDGSTDSSGAICDKYAAIEERITVVHKANGGLSDARNVGLRSATGDYVMFVDSDDYIELDACERISSFLDNECEIVICDCYVNKEGYSTKHYDGLVVGETMTGISYMKTSFQHHRFPPMAWLNIYKRTFLIDNRLFFKVGFFHEDIDYSLRVFLVANSVVYSSVHFYHYEINDNSITSAKNKTKHCEDIYNLATSIIDLYSTVQDKKLRKFVENYLASCFMSCFRNGNLYIYKEKYMHRGFAWKNSHMFKTKCKAVLYSFFPKLFCKL